MTASITVEEIYDTLDDRTVEILNHRRNGKTIRRRGWLVRRALLAADVGGLSLAFVAAQEVYAAHMDNPGPGALSDFTEFLTFAFSLPLWVVAAKLYGLYEKDEESTDHSTADDFSRVFHLVTVCTFLLFAVSQLTSWFSPEFSKLFIFWLFATLGIPILRCMSRAYCRRQIHFLQNTIIVGAGDVGQTIARKLLNHHEYGINLVGFVDANPKERVEGLHHLTVLGNREDLPSLVRLLDVERVIYAFSSESHDESLEMIRKLNELDVQVDIVPRFFEVLSPGADVHSVEGVPMWSLPPARLAHSSRFLKRCVDFLTAVVGLVVLSPLMMALAVATRWDSPGPAFFRQTRMGAGGQTFKIWKYRTMVLDADARKHEFAHLNKHLSPGGDARMFKIDDDPRVTRVGRWMRRTSLDELPQLLNVLVGEMSLVGPRPLILTEDEHVQDWGRQRLNLKPGITGPWQVLGRTDIPFSEMVRLDYLYVTSWSLMGDLKLIARTLPHLLARRGGM
jgi:exopolysaccharide biosynthesis polyprenyl glycosylphosphotransferase